jgi:hypothetical protein
VIWDNIAGDTFSYSRAIYFPQKYYLQDLTPGQDYFFLLSGYSKQVIGNGKRVFHNYINISVTTYIGNETIANLTFTTSLPPYVNLNRDLDLNIRVEVASPILQMEQLSTLLLLSDVSIGNQIMDHYLIDSVMGKNYSHHQR